MMRHEKLSRHVGPATAFFFFFNEKAPLLEFLEFMYEGSFFFFFHHLFIYLESLVHSERKPSKRKSSKIRKEAH